MGRSLPGLPDLLIRYNAIAYIGAFAHSNDTITQYPSRSHAKLQIEQPTCDTPYLITRFPGMVLTQQKGGLQLETLGIQSIPLAYCSITWRYRPTSHAANAKR